MHLSVLLQLNKILAWKSEKKKFGITILTRWLSSLEIERKITLNPAKFTALHFKTYYGNFKAGIMSQN